MSQSPAKKWLRRLRLQPIRTREDKLQAAVDLGVPLFFVALCFVAAAKGTTPTELLNPIISAVFAVLMLFGVVSIVLLVVALLGKLAGR